MKKQIIFLVCTILCTLAIGAGSIAYAVNYVISTPTYTSTRPFVSSYTDGQQQQYESNGFLYSTESVVQKTGKSVSTTVYIPIDGNAESIFASAVIESAAGFSGSCNDTVYNVNTLTVEAKLPWNAFNAVYASHGAVTEQTSYTGGQVGLSQIIYYK